ncbi:amino acid adenylation domain-containing protein [Nodularia sp. UHCC 0506]|uniref:amino acid adenylation domain-containing protein n=1 Tax=Nodularia sp. UHCC 0506 TaxID=3110243 RepID=UPI002B207613|nr:amino acid adenylation domain-containing protein [Nodularia sp. UHCC 0506]MEA5516848.1 amino acid adenylation domain-containing protein [Nodularia sp. UHCC 0506]
MSATKFLSQLLEQGVQLWVEGDRLRYHAPKGVITPDLRTQLIEYKSELLSLLANTQSAANTQPKNSSFPLTDLQQAYAIGCGEFFELGNVSAHYYVELTTKELNITQLNHAWKRLIQRHEALRVIILPDGKQKIVEEIPDYQIPVIDLRNKDAEFVNSHLEKTSQRFADHGPFIDQWPLFEVLVHHLDEQKFLLHFNISLLICDAMSSGILFNELFQLYQHPEVNLKPVEISYREYIQEITKVKGSPAYQQSHQYWWHRLNTLPPAPELPLAKQPSSLDYPRFRRWSARLEAEHWQQLKQKAMQLGLKPASTVCAAYAAVLHAWNKNPQFTINILYFNRLPIHQDVYKVLGNFSSTLLLEVDCSESINFTTHAQNLQKQLWEDLEHSSISGVEVLGELNRLQGGSSQAAMPVTFASALGLDSRQQESSSIADFWTLQKSGLQTPFVLLDHQILENQGALVLNWDAVDEAFPSGLMSDMFAAYCHFLQQLATDDTAWETNLSLVPDYQLQQRLAINADRTPLSSETLHSLFTNQVPQRPNQPAIITSQRQLTYQQLDEYSHQVGKWLHQAGASVNHLVAVVMEKGWEQIVGVFSILKAGAAYLPIDPSLPKERLWYILENSNVQLVLTQSWLDEKLAWPETIQRLCIDQIDQDQRLQMDSTALPPLQTPLDLAYVIYTSGSTGKPKGVMIDHRGAVNTILDLNRRFNVGAGDRIFAISSLSFDLSVYDIFGTLAAGATIVLPDADAIRDPGHWSDIMARQQITVWNSAPPLMQLLVDYTAEQPHGLPPSLRLVLMSGDWIPLNLPAQIKSLLPEVQTISLGGATEASIWSIFYPITHLEPEWKSIPYGRPLSNQSFHILDEALQPCPTWVTGNLYIGGVGLAWGYWGDEAKTSASFIHHPSNDERLYRTGDLGRYLPDGNIEFLGREDFQVKIRGYRIELGEIEAVLSQHPDIQTLVVTATDFQGDKQLIAYVVPVSQRHLNNQELGQFLQDKLPNYMIPSAFITLESLPITANGKLDRQALPQVQASNYQRCNTFVAPRDKWETELVQIWQETLKVEHLGVTDNFFNLGGNSISAVRLMTQIQKHFAQTLPLSTLFQQGTIEQLAQQLRQQQPTHSWSPLVEIQPQGNARPFFCVHPVGGNVLCYTQLVHHLSSNQPFYGLQASGLNPNEQPIKSIEEMATAYIEAIRQIQPQGPYLLGGWSFGGVVAFEIAQQLHEQNQQVNLLALIDCQVPNSNLVLDEALLSAWFIQDLQGDFNFDVEQLRGKLQTMTPEARLNYILQQARELNLVPIDAGLLQIQHLFQVFKTNMETMYRYSPQVYPHQLVLLRAEEQSHKNQTDHNLGWGQFATGGVQTQIIPGNHYSIFHQPQVQLLAKHLQGYLMAVTLTTA